MFALFCFPSTMIDYVGYSYCGDVVLTEEGSFGGSNTKVVCCLVWPIISIGHFGNGFNDDVVSAVP